VRNATKFFVKRTEYPHTGTYNLHFEKEYCCGACGEALFESNSKFDAHCGWPSFDESIGKYNTFLMCHGMKRTEILCANCGVIWDMCLMMDQKTGQRYCKLFISRF
jgi:peptide-methionine (R)-S-oxide reductase